MNRLAVEIEAVIQGRQPKKFGTETGFLCPAHDDHHPSARWNPEKQVWCCDACSAGGGAKDLALRLGIELPDATGGGEGGLYPPESRAQLHSSSGLTINEYADAKALPVEFLRDIGLSEIPNYNGGPAVRMVYDAPDGENEAVRFRIALQGKDRFKWRKGSKPIPYGLNTRNLALARESGYLLIVEGESDAQTCWHHGLPAIAIPGASSYRKLLNSFSMYLTGIDRLYVLIEPDVGGIAVQEQISDIKLKEKIWTFDLDEFKDASALHIAGPVDFKERMKAALMDADQWADFEAREMKARRKELWEVCGTLAADASILNQIADAVANLGVAGERRNIQLLYLILTSRLLPEIVNAALKGPSSAGKSFVLKKVLDLFPDSATYQLSGFSEKALAYSEKPLSHKFLVLFEAAGLNSDFGEYLLRSLLSEQKIKYEFVEKGPDGLHARLIERAGPTGFITTTTEISMHPENETRMLTLNVSDSPEQTREILLKGALGQSAPTDVTEFVAFQEWLELGVTSVDIPFASQIATAIPDAAIGVVRLRRDFPAVLNLIRACAIIHQQGRQQVEGHIQACRCDYEIVRELVLDVISHGLEVSVPESVRETVAAVSALETSSGSPVTIQALSKKLKLGRSATSRRARAAYSLGFLKDVGSKKPKLYSVGDPLPAPVEVLPDADSLGLMCKCARDSEGASTPPPPVRVPEDQDGDVVGF